MTVSSHPTHPSVVIRGATTADASALADLAVLDSAAPVSGPALVAEMGGRVVAALATDTGARIADPFVPTASLLDLLELRARPAREPRHRMAWAHPRARVA